MKLLTPPNLFLESQELNRLTKFIFKDGFESYLRNSSINFGIISNLANDTPYFRCGIDSALNLTLKLENGLAFDNEGKLLVGNNVSGVTIPNFNIWYWVKIKYKESVLEEGTLNVSASGTVVGTGTKFTEILRGVTSGHPSVVRLYNSTGTALASLNGTRDYQIYSVESDTVLEINAIDLQNESNLRYSVVGTFTEGSNQEPTEQQIFKYDSVDVSLVAETTLNTKPSFQIGENEGNTFWIARVRKVAPNAITVQDKRDAFWQSIADFNSKFQDSQENLVIGVESAKFHGEFTPQSSNNVTVAWGLRTNDWSFNANTLEITLLTAKGGNVKNINQIQAQNRNFAGWRLYVEGSNTFFKVVSSSYPTTSSLLLRLDTGNPDNFTIGNKVYLVPNTDFVEIIANTVNGNSLEKTNFLFPIGNALGIIDLQVNGNPYEYKLSYRYKNNETYGIEKVLPDATGVGYATQYYNELQFDEFGVLITTPVYTTYTLGIIPLKLSEKSYSILIDKLQTGEKRGVEYTAIDNGIPFRNIVLGVNKQYQVFVGAPVSLSAVNYINIKTTDSNNATVKEGAVFYFHFTQIIETNNFDIKIKQDASIINPNGTGVLIKTLNKLDIKSSSAENGLILKFVFDGTNWIYKRYTDFTAEPDLVTVSNSDFLNNWQQSAFSNFNKLKYKVGFDGYIEIFGTVILPQGSGTLTGGYNVICEIDDIPIISDAKVLPLNAMFIAGSTPFSEIPYIVCYWQSSKLRIALFQANNFMSVINSNAQIDVAINGRYPYKNT